MAKMAGARANLYDLLVKIFNHLPDEDFLKMITGELNAMSAYTGGKLKIEGDLMKSQLIEKLFKL